MRASRLHTTFDSLTGWCSILKGAFVRWRLVSTPKPIVFTQLLHVPRPYQPRLYHGGSRRAFTLTSSLQPHPKHNTIAWGSCFLESFVSPRTWIMLSTQHPFVHGAASGAQQMYLHRLSVLISFLHARASTYSASASPFSPASKTRRSLAPMGICARYTLAGDCIAASATISTNLLNPPKHWCGLIPYRLMSGSLFPQMGPHTLAKSGFWLLATGPKAPFNHVDLFPCIYRKRSPPWQHRRSHMYDVDKGRISARYEPFVRAR